MYLPIRIFIYPSIGARIYCKLGGGGGGGGGGAADCPLEIHSAARWAIVDVDNMDNVHNDDDDVNGFDADAVALLTIKRNAYAAFFLLSLNAY